MNYNEIKIYKDLILVLQLKATIHHLKRTVMAAAAVVVTNTICLSARALAPAAGEFAAVRVLA